MTTRTLSPVPIDPPGCTCDHCRAGGHVPVDRAHPDHIAHLLNGQATNNTGRPFTTDIRYEIPTGTTLAEAAPASATTAWHTPDIGDERAWRWQHFYLPDNQYPTPVPPTRNDTHTGTTDGQEH